MLAHPVVLTPHHSYTTSTSCAHPPIYPHTPPTTTTSDEEAQLTAFFKAEKERSAGRLDSQAQALRARETTLACELDGR